jgi:hypothetical protein
MAGLSEICCKKMSRKALKTDLIKRSRKRKSAGEAWALKAGKRLNEERKKLLELLA